MKVQHDNTPMFPKGNQAPAEYFTGTAWIKTLIEKPELNCTVANVVFEPGCRNNWHSHPGGQILICIDGEGYFQEKGKPIELLGKGDVVQILPDVVHWHGATPQSEFTHIAIGPNAKVGALNWMEPVTDEEYNGYK